MADILLGMESLSNNLRSPKSDPIFARTETPQADSAVAASLSSAPDSSAFISSSVSDSQHFSHQRPFRFIASSTQSSLSSTGFDETVQTAFNGSHSIYSRNLSNTAPSSNLSNPSLWTPFLGSSGYWSTPGAFCLPLGLFFLILPLTLHQHLFITLRPSRILYLLRSPLFFLPTPSPAYSSSPTSHKRQILSGCCRRWLVAACRTLRHRRLHNSFEQHYRPQDPNHDRLPHQSGFEFCQVVYLCLICLGLTGLACIAGWRLRQLPDWLEMLLKTASGTNYLPPDRSFSAQEQLKQAGDGYTYLFRVAYVMTVTLVKLFISPSLMRLTPRDAACEKLFAHKSLEQLKQI
ncbi:unnamed protein product [Protopolystoma xenopodis]|uniref:Uncharacterized protein n=1 Tax=Protopolystoma xenopodis TaxID=117903 RepID=A0A3S4ZZQ4_9PLAT|nr:unnamed protein product [Protopolystoma xenopodis]